VSSCTAFKFKSKSRSCETCMPVTSLSNKGPKLKQLCANSITGNAINVFRISFDIPSFILAIK